MKRCDMATHRFFFWNEKSTASFFAGISQRDMPGKDAAASFST